MNEVNAPDGLRGARVAVFGGASGIGFAVASAVAAGGGAVVLVGRDDDSLRNAALRIGGARTAVADIADRHQVRAALSGVGHIDHLVITAGSIVAGKVAETDPDVLLRAVRERIGGALYAVHAALPSLSRNGSITLTGGQFSDRPGAAGTSVMSAALRGVEGLARSLALELQPIRVNVISPGWTDTSLLDVFGTDAKRATLDAAAAQLPGKRVGRPEELAHAILFLMTNRFVNGEILHVDGAGRLV